MRSGGEQANWKVIVSQNTRLNKDTETITHEPFLKGRPYWKTATEQTL